MIKCVLNGVGKKRKKYGFEQPPIPPMPGSGIINTGPRMRRKNVPTTIPKRRRMGRRIGSTLRASFLCYLGNEAINT